MSDLKKGSTLDNILHISIKLVVLQNLIDCYVRESNAPLSQEIINFRSACILDELKLILDNLMSYTEWLAKVDMGLVKVDRETKKGTTKLINDLNKIYEFVLEEAAKKEARLNLIKGERELFRNE